LTKEQQMSSRQKNKHKSRHRTHAIKPASFPRVSLAKRAPVEAEPAAAATVAAAPVAVAEAEVKATATRNPARKAAPKPE